MAVYPFYVESNSSTRRTTSGVGCRAKNGHMTTSVYQRDKGDITKPFHIEQYTEEQEGVLKCITDVYYQGELIKKHTTNY